MGLSQTLEPIQFAMTTRNVKKTFSHPVKGYTRQDNCCDSSLLRPLVFNISKDHKREKETDSHSQQNEKEGQIDTSRVDGEGLAH